MTTIPTKPKDIRVLCFDPGTLIAGFGCLELRNSGEQVNLNRVKVLTAGVVRLNAKDCLTQRISDLFDAALGLIEELKPSVFVIERAFYGVNVATTLKLGEVRGALIAAAGSKGVPIVQISPARCKKVVTGKGNATKEMVSAAVGDLINFKGHGLPFDATDALALGLACIIDHQNFREILR
jgi:crossover junction endodeoxyribonuclease RuvC